MYMHINKYRELISHLACLELRSAPGSMSHIQLSNLSLKGFVTFLTVEEHLMMLIKWASQEEGIKYFLLSVLLGLCN